MKLQIEFPVHRVSTSSNEKNVIYDAFSKNIQIFNIETGSISKPLETCFDGGGQRVVVSDELETIIAGAYERHGLKGYNKNNGKQLWHRNDLKKIQYLSNSRFGEKVFCGIDGSSLHIIDVQTGNDIEKISGAKRAWRDEDSDAIFIESSRSYVLA